MIDRKPLLWFEAPEEACGPVRLSALFYGPDDRLACRVDRNEWKGEPSNWDLECKGARVTILSGMRHTALQFKTEAPHSVQIERLDMRFQGRRVVADQSGLSLFVPDGRGGEDLFVRCTGGSAFTGNDVAICI